MHGGFIQAGPQRIASLQGLRNHAVATAPVQCFRTSAYASAMSLTPAVPSPPVTSLASPSAPYSIPLASARIHRNQAVSTPHSERATARELAGETKRDGGVQRAARPSQLRYPVGQRGCQHNVQSDWQLTRDMLTGVARVGLPFRSSLLHRIGRSSASLSP